MELIITEGRLLHSYVNSYHSIDTVLKIRFWKCDVLNEITFFEHTRVQMSNQIMIIDWLTKLNRSQQLV